MFRHRFDVRTLLPVSELKSEETQTIARQKTNHKSGRFSNMNYTNCHGIPRRAIYKGLHFNPSLRANQTHRSQV